MLAWAALTFGVAVAGLAQAQTPDAAPPADDWTFAERDGVTAAFLQFDNGLDIVVRCKDRNLETMIIGLPPSSERTRELRIYGGDETAPERGANWFVAEQADTAFSSSPALFARSLREGGAMNLVVPGGAASGRNLRYVLNLPSSPSAINGTLAACGKPSVDPRDALVEPLGEDDLPVGITWAEPPRPEYPMGYLTYEWGFAAISCLSQADGSLDQCEVETQHPLDGPFGAAALTAARSARVQLGDSASPLPTRLIRFNINFRMEGEGSRPRAPTGSRLIRGG